MVHRYDGPTHGNDYALATIVSPGGSSVFVIGYSTTANGQFDYGTVAYDSSTGAQLWGMRYDGPGHGSDYAYGLGVSPGGSTVFVTGLSLGATSGFDYATLSYDAVTGAARWLRRYNGPANAEDSASDLAVSPTGERVFVTGMSRGASSNLDYATVAYSTT